MPFDATDAPGGGAAYEFRRVTQADVALLTRWLDAPHARDWCGDMALATILENLEVERAIRSHGFMSPVIVAKGGLEFGYVQLWGQLEPYEEVFGKHPEGSVGVDVLIGADTFLRKGHGTAVLRFFSDRLLRKAPRVVASLDPENRIAIFTYRSAGFVPHEQLEDDDGAKSWLVLAKEASHG